MCIVQEAYYANNLPIFVCKLYASHNLLQFHFSSGGLCGKGIFILWFLEVE